jgi:hypothetical protein
LWEGAKFLFCAGQEPGSKLIERCAAMKKQIVARYASEMFSQKQSPIAPAKPETVMASVGLEFMTDNASEAEEMRGATACVL